MCVMNHTSTGKIRSYNGQQSQFRKPSRQSGAFRWNRPGSALEAFRQGWGYKRRFACAGLYSWQDRFQLGCFQMPAGTRGSFGRGRRQEQLPAHFWWRAPFLWPRRHPGNRLKLSAFAVRAQLWSQAKVRRYRRAWPRPIDSWRGVASDPASGSRHEPRSRGSSQNRIRYWSQSPAPVLPTHGAQPGNRWAPPLFSRRSTAW